MQPSEMSTVTRRRLLRSAIVGGAGVAAGSLFATRSEASAGEQSVASYGSTPLAKPRRGGTLVAAMQGTGNDTLDAHLELASITSARLNSLYEGLATLDVDGTPKLLLAKSVQPVNKSGSQWKVKLRDGARFSDGRPVRAQDVVYSFHRILDNKFPGAIALEGLDKKNIKALDAKTVQLTFDRPNAIFGDYLASYQYYLYIVPVGYNPKKPIGSGPFTFKSFTPGQQSVFNRNPKYWRGRGAYADQLVITNFEDTNAMVNAVVSGQANMASGLSPTQVPTLKSGGAKAFVTKHGGAITPFVMRADQEPWSDPRVRQAMRLICDREQLVRQVYNGLGSVANDLYSPLDPLYIGDELPQRRPDIRKARQLLEAAGKKGMEVELVTRDSTSGMVQSAFVLAQQAKAAGVTIKVRQIPPSAFYAKYTQWNFCQSNWSYVGFWAMSASSFVPQGPYNDSHYKDPVFTRWYRQALSSANPHTRAALAAKMQRRFYEQGSEIIPAFPPLIDGYAANVYGMRPSPVYPFNNFSFQDYWVT